MLLFLQLSASMVSFVIGIVCLLTVKSLRTDKPLVFWYILLTLTAEASLLLLTGCFIVLLRVCCGPCRAAHANALCGVSLRACQGLVYLISASAGLFILWTNVGFGPPAVFGRRHQATPTNGSETATTATTASATTPATTPIIVIAYVSCEIVVSLLYTLQSLPVIYNLCGYAAHKIHATLSGQPIVVFHQSDRPLQYIQGQQYADALREMGNPVRDKRKSRQQHRPEVR